MVCGTLGLDDDWQVIMFSDESHFCLQHHDGHIHVWWHHGECLIESCIMHCHTNPTSGVMVLGAIVFQSHSSLVHINGMLTSTHCIIEVLEPVVVSYFQGHLEAIYQHDNP